MLAFLDAFCRTLAARDREAIHRWLRHPLARALPRGVRAEALAIARGAGGGHLPPTRTLHFYYQTLQLLAAGDDDLRAMALLARPRMEPAAGPSLASVR